MYSIWGNLILEEHELVAEEAGTPQQPRRSFQRTDTKSHHATSLSQLTAPKFPGGATYIRRKRNQIRVCE